MKKALIWLTSNWHLAAFIIGFHAFAWFLVANWSKNSSVQMLFYALALVTLGLLCRLKWARYAGVAVLIAMVLHKAYGFIAMGFTWSRVWPTLLNVYGAYLLWTAPNESFLKEWGLDDSAAPSNDDKDGRESEDESPKRTTLPRPPRTVKWKRPSKPRSSPTATNARRAAMAATISTSSTPAGRSSPAASNTSFRATRWKRPFPN